MVPHETLHYIVTRSTLLLVERAIAAWCFFLLTTTLVYVTIGMTRPAACALGVVFLVALWKMRSWLCSDKISFVTPKISAPIILIFALQILLVIILFLGRTNSALQSPWTQVPWWTFGIYFLETFLLLADFPKRSDFFSWVTIFFHFFISYGVALLVFKFGYGFDPLIHAAAENYSVLHGKITPLQPFYNGFYGPIVWLRQVFFIPTELLNQWFVPLLAILSVPPLLYTALIARGLTPARARAGIILASIIPIREFTLSVPHNLTALFVVWWACIATLPALRERFILLYAIAISAAVVHPLLGVPLCIATIILHANRKSISVIGWAGIAIAPIALFSVFRILHGLPIIPANLPGMQNVSAVFGFVYDVSRTRLLTQLAFGYIYLLPFAALIAGARKKNILIISALITSVILIAYFAVLPDIAWYEQNEFAFRMRSALPLFILPAIIFWGDAKINLTHGAKKIFILFFVAIAITVSWFFTYPGNTGVTNPGYNVSADDISAVKYITMRAGTTPYIVLAPQITAGAARNILGFDYSVKLKNGRIIFPYAEGPSSELHTYTDAIFYDHFLLSDFGNVFAQKITSLYVVVPNYWYRKEDLLGELLAANPREVVPLDGATIFVFE